MKENWHRDPCGPFCFRSYCVLFCSVLLCPTLLCSELSYSQHFTWPWRLKTTKSLNQHVDKIKTSIFYLTLENLSRCGLSLYSFSSYTNNTSKTVRTTNTPNSSIQVTRSPMYVTQYIRTLLINLLRKLSQNLKLSTLTTRSSHDLSYIYISIFPKLIRTY